MYFDHKKGAKKVDELFSRRGLIVMLVVLAIFVGIYFLTSN